MALSFMKMLNSGLLHLTGGFIVYYAWVLTMSLRCDNWYFSCGKMIIMEMKLSEHYVMWANESMFSFVRSSLANWLRCETKFNGQPLRKDSSVIVISLQGLIFVLDKHLVVVFMTNILATIKFSFKKPYEVSTCNKIWD